MTENIREISFLILQKIRVNPVCLQYPRESIQLSNKSVPFIQVTDLGLSWVLQWVQSGMSWILQQYELKSGILANALTKKTQPPETINEKAPF